MITTTIFITIIIIIPLGEVSKCFGLLIPMLKKGGHFNNLSHKREELGRAQNWKDRRKLRFW